MWRRKDYQIDCWKSGDLHDFHLTKSTFSSGWHTVVTCTKLWATYITSDVSYLNNKTTSWGCSIFHMGITITAICDLDSDQTFLNPVPIVDETNIKQGFSNTNTVKNWTSFLIKFKEKVCLVRYIKTSPLQSFCSQLQLQSNLDLNPPL